MKRALLPLAGVVALALLAAWWNERHQSIALRQEIHELRDRLAAASQLSATTPPSPNPQSSENLERLRADANEVHKLRNEISQLRAGTKELEQLRAENQRLRAANSPRPGTNLATTPDATSPATLYPKENWTFAGYASPEAALQSVAWAMREGDVQTLLGSVTPEERKRMQSEWGDKSESEVSDNVRRGLEKVNSLQVLETRNVSADEVVLSVYAVGGEDHVQRIVLQRSGAEWKFAGPKKD